MLTDAEKINLEQKEHIEDLNEQIKACKELLAEKHNQTAGFQQENAETQVLLVEAQDILNQKLAECEEMENKNSKMKVEIEKY